MENINVDALIVGGGIAGLWMHHRLNDLGYTAVLLEKKGLGGAQTLSSQGIIHGGVKYTLGGMFTGAASAISDMPAIWLDSLNGTGEIDLTGTQILSDNQLMWSSRGVSSKLTSFLSSKVLRGKVFKLHQEDYPVLFDTDQFDGLLYQLNEPVIDVPSLIENLSQKWKSRIICSVKDLAFTKNEKGELAEAVFNDQKIRIAAKQFVFAAGEGNEAILNDLSIRRPKMQKRPLKMVLAKGQDLSDLYAHCLGPSSKPIATITSHLHSDSEKIWYIGGAVAEEGVGLTDDDLIQKTKTTLHNILPWIDLEQLSWATHSVNRAEPAQSGLMRPDTAFIETSQNFHVCWPTKLALTPSLSSKVIEKIIMKLSKGEQSTLLDEKLSHVGEQFKPHVSPSLWERSY